MRISIYRHALSEDPKAKAEAEAALARADEKFDNTAAKYARDDISDDTDRKMLEADRAALKRYRAGRAAMLEKSRANDFATAQAMLVSGELNDASSALHKAIDDHIDYNGDLGDLAVTRN